MLNRLDGKNTTLRILIATLSLLAAACSLAHSPICGVVVEEGSNRPLVGATVISRWTSQGSAAGVDSRTSCVRVDFSTTDAQGRFELPWYSPALPWGNASAWVEVYKPGYERVLKVNRYGQIEGYQPPPAEQRIVTRPFSGQAGERLRQLNSVVAHTNCGERHSRKAEYDLFVRLHDEAARYAKSPEQVREAESYLRFARELLVNETKPTRYDRRGELENIDPRDSLKLEDLR